MEDLQHEAQQVAVAFVNALRTNRLCERQGHARYYKNYFCAMSAVDGQPQFYPNRGALRWLHRLFRVRRWVARWDDKGINLWINHDGPCRDAPFISFPFITTTKH